jgi:hypothetical protein
MNHHIGVIEEGTRYRNLFLLYAKSIFSWAMIENSDIDQIYLLSHKDIKLACTLVKRWRKYLFERTITDRVETIDVITQIYKTLGLQNKPIFFLEGVTTALKFIEREFPPSDNYPDIVHCNNYEPLISDLFYLVLKGSDEENHSQSPHAEAISEILVREQNISSCVHYGIFSQLHQDYYLGKIIDIAANHINNCYLQYCFEELKLNYNQESWNILKNLAQECPYLIPLSKACIVIERPIEIHLDHEGLPHAYNQPAMIFGDGFKVYYHHGIPFAAKYGEVLINDWKPEWILSEEERMDRMILIHTIGYKCFHNEYPHVDFWRQYDRTFYESASQFSIDIIISWQLYHHNQLYLKCSQADALKINAEDARNIIDSLPFKLPTELWSLYQYYNGGYQLTLGLYFYPVKQAIQASSILTGIKSDTGYPFPLFKGTRDEIYYVLADDPEPTYSHIYCIFPGEEPIVYAECVTSLIVTIAQCYQEGAYYIAIDEETGARSIEQDLDKIEPIFEKFNPDRIDNWRKIWKS